MTDPDPASSSRDGPGWIRRCRCACAADRAGLLVCGDVAAGMTMLLRDEPNFSAIRSENTDIALEALRRRVDVRELFAFALSDDFFRLRQKIGLSV